jgi:hypothetical protein
MDKEEDFVNKFNHVALQHYDPDGSDSFMLLHKETQLFENSCSLKTEKLMCDQTDKFFINLI